MVAGFMKVDVLCLSLSAPSSPQVAISFHARHPTQSLLDKYHYKNRLICSPRPSQLRPIKYSS